MASSDSSEVVKRMTVTMEDDLYEQVETIAKEQERTVPNLLVYLARLAVKEAQDRGELPPTDTDATTK